MRSVRNCDGGERGSVLILVVVLVLLSGLGAVVALTVSDAAYQRVSGDYKLDKACQIADAGLSFYVEQWRRSSTFLDSATYPATTTAQNANVNVGRACGGGTFTATSIDRVSFAGSGSEGRFVTIRGEYDNVRYTFRALLAPNMSSPIQGVGTKAYQKWYSGSVFNSTGEGVGTLFGNTTGTFNGSANSISGNAKFVTSITDPNNSITGTETTGTAAVTFPSQGTIINGKISDVAANRNTTGFWQNATTNILAAAVATGGTKPTAMERVPATVTRLNSTTWSGSNQMNMSHWYIRGGNMSLAAGNYAFGRLYLDGTILTLKAASGGSALVMPDVYLANGARLILDTTDGPFTVVTGDNNAYSGSIGTTNAQRYNSGTNAFANGTPSLKVTGDTGVWNGAGGNVGGSVKPQSGTGSGYDDWLVKDSSILATVTPNVSSKGAEVFMKAESDMVLKNGGSIIGGIQPGDLTALKTSSTTFSTINSMGNNSLGFLTWNAGGASLPRLNISAGQGAGGLGSTYVGLTYGGFEGTIGAGGTMVGAFVGKQLDNYGTVRYDSRLLTLVSSGDADSQHVVVRTRVQ